MKLSELKSIIREELENYMNSLDEKSVPEPYDRKNRRKMTKSQISDRDRIGKKMKANRKTVAKFKKKFGADWKDYLWASASNAAIRGGEKQ